MKNSFSGWGVHFSAGPQAFHEVGFSERELGCVLICDFISSGKEGVCQCESRKSLQL